MADGQKNSASVITGSVKWFNLVKGFGFITRDDSREDIFVHQTAIQANGYRSLEEGEKVRFMITDSDKGKVAVLVTSRDGGSVKGASRKSRIKKGARKYTNKCFNCNATGHRVKSCPYEKKDNKTCHNCGSQEHLILKCPKLVKGLKKMVDELTDLKKDHKLNNACTEEKIDKNNES